MNSDFEIILYYKYTNIEDPQKMMFEQRLICETLGLKGRILIAKEGINGTLEGTSGAIKKYSDWFLKQLQFSDVTIKKSIGNGNAFPKLKVKVRNEIVTSSLGEKNIDPRKVTGKYLIAEQLHQWFEAGKEFYIVDMRNEFELKAGMFEKTVPAGLKYFRDLSGALPKLQHLKNKTVVTVCTGGVRCEKASGFLVMNDFVDVYQLKDGIHTYMEKFPNEHFKGKLYVFDNRILLGFNTTHPKHQVIGRCQKCNQVSENYINCAYDDCHAHFICCENCLINGKAFCSENCKQKLMIMA